MHMSTENTHTCALWKVSSHAQLLSHTFRQCQCLRAGPKGAHSAAPTTFTQLPPTHNPQPPPPGGSESAGFMSMALRNIRPRAWAGGACDASWNMHGCHECENDGVHLWWGGSAGLSVSFYHCCWINEHAYYLLCLLWPPTGTHVQASQPRRTWRHLFPHEL